jgi:serine/threonine protein kinase
VAGLPQPGDIWNDRYEITTVLGRGGFGRVYRGWDRLLERDVAIKMLRPSEDFTPTEQQRFRRETNIAASLDHPNIVTVYDGGDRDGLLYLVMRFVAGRDLRYELQDGPLAQRRALSILRQIGSALDHAHARGLVHRDIKPGNILCLADTDTVYLADFGISRPVDQTTDNPVTQGLAPATLAYAAPEQMRAGARVDGRTDVYALGCVLFECLTGRKPFQGDLAAMVNAHLNDAPPRVSELRADLSPAWDEVIAASMAKDPAQRYRRCAAFAAAAERVLTRSGLPVAHATPAAPPRVADVVSLTGHARRPPLERDSQTRRFERGDVETAAVRPLDDEAHGPPASDPPPRDPHPPPSDATPAGDTPGRPTPDPAAPAGDTPGRPTPDHAAPAGDTSRRPALAAAVVGAVVMIGLIWALVQAMTGGAEGRSAGGGAAADAPVALEAAQRELLERFGAYEPPACRPPTRTQFAGEQVAIACADDAQAPTRVVFRRFGSTAERDDAFAALAGRAGDGDCSVDRRAAHSYTGNAGSGRVVCGVDDSRVGLSWTVADGPLMGSARIDDPGAADQLYDWWSEVVQRSDR